MLGRVNHDKVHTHTHTLSWPNAPSTRGSWDGLDHCDLREDIDSGSSQARRVQDDLGRGILPFCLKETVI